MQSRGSCTMAFLPSSAPMCAYFAYSTQWLHKLIKCPGFDSRWLPAFSLSVCNENFALCTQFTKSHIFYSKSRENPYQVLQVTQESVSGTTSHVRCV